MERLKGLDVEWADLNRDGVIKGDNEVTALFCNLAVGKDRFEQTTRTPRLFGLLGTAEKKTDAGRYYEVLSNVAGAPKNPPKGQPGHDPFFPKRVLSTGKYKGESTNTGLQRSVVQLSAADAAKYGAKPGELAFANFSHEGKFWVAMVPPNAVKDIDMMLEHFPAIVPAAHSMLRFRLKDGQEARLVPQTEGSDDKPRVLKDLVLSIEATAPKNFKYGLVDGLFNNFAAAYRMESVQDRAAHTKNNGHRVEQIPLKFSEQEKQRILKEAITTSHQRGLKTNYNTIASNCTNEAMHIIDRGVGNKVPVQVHVSRALTTETLPTNSRFYLGIRGLLDKKASRMDLADEIAANQSK